MVRPFSCVGPMNGRAYVGLAKYKNVVLQSHPRDWALAALQEVDGFGNAMPAFQELASNAVAPVIQSYGMWKDNHVFTEKDLPLILNRAQAFNKLATQYKGIDFIFAPTLEHSISDVKLSEKFLNESAKAAPKCQIVNNPVRDGARKGAFSKKYENEIHGVTPEIPSGRFAISADGKSLVDYDVTKWKSDYSKATRRLIWDPNDNGRLETKDTTPRGQRGAYLTVDCNNSLIFLATDKMPGWCKSYKGFLYKSHADCHYIKDNPRNGLDARSNKPCLIVPQQFKKIELVTAFGQVLGTFSKQQPYEDGRFRAYLPEFGFKYAQQAIKLTKGPHLAVVADGKQIAVINPGFRENEYRK